MKEPSLISPEEERVCWVGPQLTEFPMGVSRLGC